MNDLVALDLEAGPAFVSAMERAWEAGDAVFAVDQRLPSRAKQELFAAVAPTVVVDAAGSAQRVGRGVEDGDALVVATSGTTAGPRFAVLTHDAVAASARITSNALGVDPRSDRWLCCLPVAHIGGLSVITRAILTGTPLTVLPGFDEDGVSREANRGATLVSLVVATLGRVDPKQFRRILLGGSAIPEDRPTNSVATYGMTETGSGVVYDGWALEDVQVRVEGDEVLLRTPTLMRAYRDGADPPGEDGWFATGDAGLLDESGKLSVSGRIGDVIVTGGEKVWPALVEKALQEVGVSEGTAIVGRPDREWGAAVTLVVEAGTSVPAIEELRETLSDRLPPYSLPRLIEIVERLPRTPTGKVRRNRL